MYQIQKLNPRHFKILDLVIEGLSQKEIAERLSMTPQAVTILTNSPSFQHELALRRGVAVAQQDDKKQRAEDAALETLRSGAVAAAQRLVGNLAHDSASVQNKSATEILDRIGIGKVQKLDATVKSASLLLTSEDAATLLETLKMVS